MGNSSGITSTTTSPSTGPGPGSGDLFRRMKDIPEGFKIVLIGEPAGGKTNIFQRYFNNRFETAYTSSLKPDCKTIVRKVNVPCNAVLSVTLWDIPGSEDMDLRDSYYRNADAAIVVADMNDDTSIKMAGSWKQEFSNKVNKVTLDVPIARYQRLPLDVASVPVLLLGNKYDLVEEKQETMRLQQILKTPLKLNSDSNTVLLEEETNQDLMEDRLFTPQHGPDPGQVKPPCVVLLEKVQKQYAFVGSVMVSASDGDSSVHAAVQSLLRFLIEHSTQKEPKFQQPDLKTVMKKKKPKETEWVIYCGVEELDIIYRKVVRPVKRVDEMMTLHDISLRRLKQKCADLGLLHETKASLEDCIICVRDAIRAAGSMNLCAREKNNFIELYYEQDYRVKVPREIDIAIEQFNKEYAVVCCILLRDGPTLDAFLARLYTQMDTCAKSVSNIDEYTSYEKKNLLDICDKNMAHVAFARSEIREWLSYVQSVEAKVHDSIIW